MLQSHAYRTRTYQLNFLLTLHHHWPELHAQLKCVLVQRVVTVIQSVVSKFSECVGS